MPGIERSRRAPSSTTSTASVLDRSPLPCCVRSSVVRWLTVLASSAMRRPVVSVLVPVSDSQSRLSGRACGSHRSQSHCAAPCSSESTMIDRSLGLCRVAAWATSQRAVAYSDSPGPATPSTPTSVSETATGTSRSIGGSGRSFGLPPATSMVDRSELMPSRSSRRSASPRRRSHSRRRGPSAVTSTVAGSGQSSRRSRRSRRAAAASFFFAVASSARYSAVRCRWVFFPCRRIVM